MAYFLSFPPCYIIVLAFIKGDVNFRFGAEPLSF